MCWLLWATAAGAASHCIHLHLDLVGHVPANQMKFKKRPQSYTCPINFVPVSGGGGGASSVCLCVCVCVGGRRGGGKGGQVPALHHKLALGQFKWISIKASTLAGTRTCTYMQHRSM